MTPFHEVVIVGGGVGGSALAASLAAAGVDVLLLEQTEVFEDRVRGEWIAPWGVAEVRRMGLLDVLRDAGGHYVTRHVTYDESRTPQEAEAATLPLGMFAADIPGPLTLGNPHHCQTLFDEATRRGATTLRGAMVVRITPGADPAVTYLHSDVEHTVRCRLIVGADGRASAVREACGVALNQDRPHHWFAGMLVDQAPDWPDDLQAIGTEGDFGFLAFPQGGGKVRLYGSYALEQKRRFAGPEGPRQFLDAFNLTCSPVNETLLAGTPAGPVLSFFNNDTWTDQPFAEGVVLIGDAAGWNDPIVGLGQSITYRDARTVHEVLTGGGDWSPAAFADYGAERAERMRRLRFCAAITSVLDAEFGPEARARRRRHFERSLADPSLGMHGFAIMAGPETLPPEVFTPEHRARVLESSLMDIEDFNRRWLAAWTAKDVEALIGFYAPDCTYKDPQTAAGIVGHDALRGYLTGLFAATPPMTYEPETVWAIAGGFCGRWYCTIAGPDGPTRMRGFDLVEFDGDRIGWNEVYVHPLP